MIRALPVNHPAHGLNLNVDVTDPNDGSPTTLSAIEQRAHGAPTFANVRHLFDALDRAYPRWREGRVTAP